MASMINVGDKIELTKLNRSTTDDKNQDIVKYISKVLEKENDYEMKIAMPIQGGKIIPLSVGESFNACFYGSTGTIYECRIHITDRYKEGNLFILDVEVVSQIKKVQRRNFYRYTCMLAMQYILLPQDTEDDLEASVDDSESKEGEDSKVNQTEPPKEEQQTPRVWKQAVAMDISGGGVRIASKVKEEEGILIEMKLPLVDGEDKKVLYLKARIIRTVPSSKNGIYELRVEFVDIKEADREVIIKYIFDMERKKRQMEKGLA